MLKFNNISKLKKKENFRLNIFNHLFTGMLMVLVDLDHILEKFHVLMDVYQYVILQFQKVKLESKDFFNESN